MDASFHGLQVLAGNLGARSCVRNRRLNAKTRELWGPRAAILQMVEA